MTIVIETSNHLGIGLYFKIITLTKSQVNIDNVNNNSCPSDIYIPPSV